MTTILMVAAALGALAAGACAAVLAKFLLDWNRFLNEQRTRYREELVRQALERVAVHQALERVAGAPPPGTPFYIPPQPSPPEIGLTPPSVPSFREEVILPFQSPSISIRTRSPSGRDATDPTQTVEDGEQS